MPCSAFLSKTFALGTAAPVASVTVPVMEAVSWAQAAAHKTSMTTKNPIRCSIELNFMVNFFSSCAVATGDSPFTSVCREPRIPIICIPTKMVY